MKREEGMGKQRGKKGKGRMGREWKEKGKGPGENLDGEGGN